MQTPRLARLDMTAGVWRAQKGGNLNAKPLPRQRIAEAFERNEYLMTVATAHPTLSSPQLRGTHAKPRQAMSALGIHTTKISRYSPGGGQQDEPTRPFPLDKRNRAKADKLAL